MVTNARYEAGRQLVRWTGDTDGGGRAAAGIYLCRMKAGAFESEKRMTLLP